MRQACVAAAAAGLMCSVATAQLSPFIPGDIALGVSASTAGFEQVRDGIFLGGNDTFTFVQSMSFDNAGGFSHNAAGNLLGLNFGPDNIIGGALYNFATDGTTTATQLYQFDGAGVGTTSPARTSGISVSPDNSTIAVFGNNASIYFLEFNDGGANAGDGLSASITDAWETGPILGSGTTQGTAWIDNTTVVVATIDGGVLKVLTIEGIDTATNTFGAVTIRLGDFPNLIGPAGTINHTAVAYDPAVFNPYVYILAGSFDSGAMVSRSTVTVVDPATWTLVGEVDLDGSLGTAREVALSADGLSLFMTQFPFGSTAGGTADMSVDRLNLDVDGNFIVNASDITAIPADSSQDYYLAQTNSSFMGLDVAHSTSSLAPIGACCTTTVSTGCLQTTQADCTARNGTFSIDVPCSAVNCDPVTGGCCVGGSCSIQTAANCAAMGGAYVGDNTDCAGVICTGACCLADGACMDVNGVAECDLLGGTFQGPGTECATTACPQPATGERSGACCTDGVCSVMASNDCTAQGGTYLGDGTTCAGADCDLGEQITKFDFDNNVVGGRNLSFTLNPDLAGSAVPYTFPGSVFDVFGPVSRAVNADFRDDSITMPPDAFGILTSTKTDNVFGIEDPANTNNPDPNGAFAAEWSFDVSGHSDVRIVMEFAAIGDFEADPTTGDHFDFTASIDGGTPVPVFTSTIGENFSGIYTLEDGGTNTINDPVFMDGTLILNRYIRLVSPPLGSGSTLTLSLNGLGNGGSEVFTFDNICLLGQVGGPVCPCEFDGTAGVNVFDLLAYLDLWFANAPGADIDGTPGVNVFDLLAFLDCWFPASAGNPCP